MSYMTKTTRNQEGGTSLKCTLDNLVFYVENVSLTASERLKHELHLGELKGLSPVVRSALGNGASEYRQNLHIGQGGGAVMVSYKHNSKRVNLKEYRMRVEFNPAKQNKSFDWFWITLKEITQQYVKRIKHMDIAFDVPVHVSNISSVSLTGRDRSLFKNTVYFGASGLTGRLKIYDKKKEMEQKQGIEIEEEELTRIEYSKKYEDPITLGHLESVSDLGINNEYTITNFNLGNNKGVIKASILAIQNGEMEMKEFSRSYIVKIKKAFADMDKLDLDHAYRNAKKMILDDIRLYLD